MPTGITFTIHVYEEDDKVYIYHPGDAVFSLRYDFNAVAGDSWIYTEGIYSQDTLYYFVDSVSTITLEGQTYQAQFMRIENPNLPFSTELETVIPGIGSLNQFRLPEPSELTVFGDIYLGCYSSLETGLLHFSNRINCDDLALPAEEERNSVSFTVSPNPASGDCTVKFQLPTTTPAEILLSDSYGRILQQHPLPPGSESLTLRGLEQGLYFITLKVDGEVVRTEKLLRF